MFNTGRTFERSIDKIAVRTFRNFFADLRILATVEADWLSANELTQYPEPEVICNQP